MGRAPRPADVIVDTRQQRPGADQRHEAYLLQRVADRDVRAFEDLYRAYHPRLIRFLGNIVKHRHLTEDALDDTMMVVWNQSGDYDGSCKVSTWVFAIGYRTALNIRRKWKDARPQFDWGPDANAECGPEEHLNESEVRSALMSAISELSSDHRSVVDLAYFQEFGYREIAEIMGCPVDTVKTRMFHARHNLKKLLGGRLAEWI